VKSNPSDAYTPLYLEEVENSCTDSVRVSSHPKGYQTTIVKDQYELSKISFQLQSYDYEIVDSLIKHSGPWR